MASSKKKKEKKKDFIKQKLRVGKTKPKSTTYTDTSFRSRAISLPSQVLVQSDKPLAFYLPLLRHQNRTTRREALGHIQRTYISSSASASVADLQQIVQKICPLLLDTSASVRAAAATALAEVPPAILDTSTAHIALYLNMAMTHIRPEVRDTSTRALDVLVERVPRQVCRVAFAASLRCFVTLLGWQDVVKSIATERAKEAARARDRSGGDRSSSGKNGKGFVSTNTSTNSIIAGAALELNRDVIKARTAHVKSLAGLLKIGLMDEAQMDAYTEKSSLNEEEEEEEEDDDDSDEDDNIDEEKVGNGENKPDQDDIVEVVVVEGGKNRPSFAQLAMSKFITPSTSVPYLSLDLFSGEKTGFPSGKPEFSKPEKNGSSGSGRGNSNNNSNNNNGSNSPGLGLSTGGVSAVGLDPANVTVTEDCESRRQLVDYYKPAFELGLNTLLKEGGELGRHAKHALEVLETLQE
ncbi:uncharacterized protein SAPINGB_P000988 [Magnusiomyces paraingens]|uniref:Pre-rRNA-processing protein n=1 Tax=Magnusiomyces paraingens TaxID=2606893 RepID=A0A5E8B570_9ASCO|nr:uncharacterized protein SAPINGB_P000988 [Saprochaete ingens]VVT45983.1 unnamed protein product [Saprochaete ingens]